MKAEKENVKISKTSPENCPLAANCSAVSRAICAAAGLKVSWWTHSVQLRMPHICKPIEEKVFFPMPQTFLPVFFFFFKDLFHWIFFDWCFLFKCFLVDLLILVIQLSLVPVRRFSLYSAYQPLCGSPLEPPVDGRLSVQLSS